MANQRQLKKSFYYRTSRQGNLNYLLFLPQGYHEHPEKRWPLIFFLHGAGERGKDIRKVAVHGPPKIVRKKPDFPFIVLSPQCPARRTWSDEPLIELLDEVTRGCRVDRSRVYLTGISMGGYGAWSLGLKYPGRFAGVAPICGGGDVLQILLPPAGRERLLKKLPVWAFHGAKDDIVPVEETERMVNALLRIGNRHVKLTIYPEAAHDSWTETYERADLYEWFLRHKRRQASTP